MTRSHPFPGAPFIGCAEFVVAVEHYDYRSPETHADADVPHGAGYYRHAHAPPVDPLEQSRSILQQAADAGAPFIACAEFVSELQWRAPRHRTSPPMHARTPPPMHARTPHYDHDARATRMHAHVHMRTC